MDRAEESTQGEGTVRDLGAALAIVMEVSRPWTIAMVALAVLSCLSVTHTDGGLTVGFGVTATTLGVVALIWLPALLRLLSLTGGRLKAAGVEASSGGLLGSPEDLINRLTRIKTATEEAGRQAPEAGKVLQSVDQEVDQMATEYLSGSKAVNEEAVDLLAREYEKTRATMSPGNDRTAKMTRLVNEALVRAGADTKEAMRWGSRLIRSRGEGERIVGLAFLQVAPTRDTLEDILSLVYGSATAFEMYHALQALERLAPHLTKAEKSQAIEVLSAEQADPRGVGIAADPYLPLLLEGVIATLK